MAGARRGQATLVTSTPASWAWTIRGYEPERTVASVASSPIRRLRVAWTAAWASGPITPISGVATSRCSQGSTDAVAVLQATTISLTSCTSSQRAIASARRRSSSTALSP